MKVVYASRTGNVEKLVQKVGATDTLKIKDGTETVDGDYVIFTYTDGKGIVPKPVAKFLEANPGVKAVVGSGNQQWHGDTFNFAAQKIADQYDVPVIAKVDGEGTDDDVETIKAAL